MMKEKPTLKQLEYFISVADAGSFRAAAERLGISQATMSSQLHALENRLQIILFERSRSGTILSPAGRELITNARQVLIEAQGIIDKANLMGKGPGGTYKIGVSPTVGPYLMPHILPQLHKQFNDLRLYVREQTPNELEAELIEGKLDLVLMPLPLENTKLEIEFLFKEPLKLVLPINHKLAGLKKIKNKQIAGESVLTLEKKYTHYHQVQVFCQQWGAIIERNYEGTSLDAIRQMVVMEMGIAFLPALYLHTEMHLPDSLCIADMDNLNLCRNHVLAWRGNSPNRVFYRKLANIIKNLIKANLADADLSYDL